MLLTIYTTYFSNPFRSSRITCSYKWDKIQEDSMSNPTIPKPSQLQIDPELDGQPAEMKDDHAGTTPTVVCFHGSGDNPLPGWQDFIEIAQREYTVVLLDRGTQRVSLTDANSAIVKHLQLYKLNPPYILVAHSHGGAFAKMFLHRNPKLVAGMLLVETGQEGGLPEKIERTLLNQTPLGDKPLSVIRGNSLIANWKILETAEAAADSESKKAELSYKREVLHAYEVEDERLKKAQLRMSTNTRYVHLPDCGHGVINDRPDVVLEELRWISTHLEPEIEKASPSLWCRFRELWQASRSR